MKIQKLIDAVALMMAFSAVFILIAVALSGSDAKQVFGEIVVPIFKISAVIAIGLTAWAMIIFPTMWLFGKVNARCWFGHRKKWLAVYLFQSVYGPGGTPSCPAKDSHSDINSWAATHHHWQVVQIGRWVCEREGCLAMGEKCFGDASKKRYTIEYGRLVKDEKVWANPHAQQEVKS